MKRHHKVLTGIAAGALIVGAVMVTNHPTPVSCHTDGIHPDATCTPGMTDPFVTQGNIKQTICTPGYTAAVRPPVSYTNPLKKQLMGRYGDTDSPANYELDHLISLELGGNASSPANLWPEPYSGSMGAKMKDQVENRCHVKVCGGLLPLAKAQHEIATDWPRACQ